MSCPADTQTSLLLAPTKDAGAEHAKAFSIEPVAIFTPRRTDGARGLTADEILDPPRPHSR